MQIHPGGFMKCIYCEIGRHESCNGMTTPLTSKDEPKKCSCSECKDRNKKADTVCKNKVKKVLQGCKR